MLPNKKIVLFVGVALALTFAVFAYDIPSSEGDHRANREINLIN